MALSPKRNESGKSVRIPMVSSFRELDPEPRRFLYFGFFNIISWQCIAGPFLVLFARHIDMPPSRVGILLSFMPLSMLLVLGTVPLVTRLGSRRVMLTAWSTRCVFACSVFLMPWAIAQWGERAGWYVLMAATLLFCLARSMGVGGWFPWLHELVPEHQRGVFFSAETALVHFVNILVMLCQSLLLSGGAELNRFLMIYGFGIASGFISVIRLSRIPGGKGTGASMTLRESVAHYREALGGRPFLRFIIAGGLGLSSVSWLASVLVLYMRDMLRLPPNTVMLFMAAGSIGTLVTIQFWGRFADHSGSGRAMFKGLIGHSLAAVLCFTLLPGARWSPYLLVIVIFFAYIFAAAYAMAANRALLLYVGPSSRMGYTNTWLVATSIAFGLTPILAGFLVDRLALSGFRICFGISAVLGLVCAVACRLLVHGGKPLDKSITQYLNPALPIRLLARIVWITVGMHESSRGTSESSRSRQEQ